MVEKKGESKSGRKRKRVNKPDAENAETASQGESIDEAMGIEEITPSEVGRCPQCGSTQGYTQLTTGAWICRKCGKATLVDGTVVDAKDLIRR